MKAREEIFCLLESTNNFEVTPQEIRDKITFGSCINNTEVNISTHGQSPYEPHLAWRWIIALSDTSILFKSDIFIRKITRNIKAPGVLLVNFLCDIPDFSTSITWPLGRVTATANPSSCRDPGLLTQGHNVDHGTAAGTKINMATSSNVPSTAEQLPPLRAGTASHHWQTDTFCWSKSLQYWINSFCQKILIKISDRPCH